MESNRAQLLLNDIQLQPGLKSALYLEKPEKLTGGYDTEIYRFQLTNVHTRLSGPLILRSFPLPNDGHRVRREGSVQSVLAAEGLAVPNVHLTIDNPKFSAAPFMVMDFVSGKTLLELGEPDSSEILGSTHGILHEHPVESVIKALQGRGVIDIFLPDLLSRIVEAGKIFPWAHELTRWLTANVPKEGGRSICHGDFHKLNILQDRGRVTAILDWSNFAILEPAFDVANTQISFLILAKYLTSEGDFEAVDLEQVVAVYLKAYQGRRAAVLHNLEYYLVLRGTMILFLAALKVSKPYQHPGVVKDVCDLIGQHSRVVVQSQEIVGS